MDIFRIIQQALTLLNVRYFISIDGELIQKSNSKAV